jgi:hypothetical protein
LRTSQSGEKLALPTANARNGLTPNYNENESRDADADAAAQRSALNRSIPIDMYGKILIPLVVDFNGTSRDSPFRLFK